MGKEYIALIDIIPEDTDTEFDELAETLKKTLPDSCTIEHYDIMPVAFGLKKIRARIRYPEEWGGTDKLEELLNQVEGIQGIEALGFSKA
ncbi:MAG: elongation factor 1-beta [Candidatus Lokiarchaeota archaeon]|nr:elongation factor 1-beta [Candidatus Lokiarchaeota archaeon]